LDVDVFSFTQLVTQHNLRADDGVFCALNSKEMVRPPLRFWPKWRARLTADFSICSLLPLVSESSKIGLQTRGYAALAAAVSGIGPLLTMSLHKMPIIPHDFTLICIAGDAIAAAFPGGPGGGKVFTLYMKPVSLSTLQQSPTFAIPILVCLGVDSGARLSRVCDEWKPTLAALPASVPISASRAAIPVVFVTGDFAFITSILTVPRCNRPFPTTGGRVDYFNKPICWHCGAGGSTLYNRGSWLDQNVARLDEYSCILGLPLTCIFYAPVHAVVNVVCQLLSDLCFSFQRFAPCGVVHPVTDFILSLFPREQWDPLLSSAENRKKDRKSRRPHHHVDPGFVFGFIRSEHSAKLTALLRDNPFQWAASALPGTRYAETEPDAEPRLEFAAPRSALTLWICALKWFDAIVFGLSKPCETFGRLMIDVWFEMLALTRPIPDGVACAALPRPSFYIPVVGFGPAAHVAVCSMPKFIAFVRMFTPGSIADGFMKIASEIWLEHAQAQVRRIVMDFRIAAKVRKQWAPTVLQRMLEGLLVNLAATTVTSTSTEAPENSSKTDRPDSRPAKRVRAPQTNSAYKSCELSLGIPASVYEVAHGTAEWAALSS
jgi:hypothetical protein